MVDQDDEDDVPLINAIDIEDELDIIVSYLLLPHLLYLYIN